MEKSPFVYIMASKRNGTLYTGVTSDLVKRVWEHREGRVDGFTKRYGVKRLVYFEPHGDMYAAITREKQIKKWSREWKVRLIEAMNPEWRDLWETIIGRGPEVGGKAGARNGFPPSRE
jgi:putative endonuclease